MPSTFFVLRGKNPTLGKKFRPLGSSGLSRTALPENSLSPSERAALVALCSVIPGAVAKSYRGSAAYEEALSAAGEGVWRAAMFWRPELCQDVRTYATQWAAGLAIKAVQRWRAGGFRGGPANGFVFTPVRLGFCRGHGGSDDDEISGAPGVADPVDLDFLKKLLGALRLARPRLWVVVEAHALRNRSFTEIAREDFGGTIGRARVQQMNAAGLRYMRRLAEAGGGDQ